MGVHSPNLVTLLVMNTVHSCKLTLKELFLLQPRKRCKHSTFSETCCSAYVHKTLQVKVPVTVWQLLNVQTISIKMTPLIHASGVYKFGPKTFNKHDLFQFSFSFSVFFAFCIQQEKCCHQYKQIFDFFQFKQCVYTYILLIISLSFFPSAGKAWSVFFFNRFWPLKLGWNFYVLHCGFLNRTVIPW
jgi:hypothetical protein